MPQVLAEEIEHAQDLVAQSDRETKAAAQKGIALEKDAARAKKDRERARVKMDKEVDQELAALKKKIGK